MGQYYKICNIDKLEYIRPHAFGDGAKLMEFGMSGSGAAAVLAAALLWSKDYKGPWSGNRVVVTGDYADAGKFVPVGQETSNLYQFAEEPKTLDANAIEDNLLLSYRELKSAKPFTEYLPGCTMPANWELTMRAKLLENHTFAQPEDLFDELDSNGSEDLVTCIEGISRVVRVAQLHSEVAWLMVESASLDIDDATGLARSITVGFAPPRYGEVKNQLHKRPFSRTLMFPVSSKDLMNFYEVKSPATIQN